MQVFNSSVGYLFIMEDCIHLTHEIYVYYNYNETLKLIGFGKWARIPF